MIKMIVSADSDWGIGKDGKLLKTHPKDFKIFRERTLDMPVIYGRKTLETFPNKEPLNRRYNFLLTRDTSIKEVKGIEEVFHSIEEFLNNIDIIYSDYSSNDIYVIGGAEIYEQLLPYTSEIYITRWFGKYGADTYFPNNLMKGKFRQESVEYIYDDENQTHMLFTIEKYKNLNVKSYK